MTDLNYSPKVYIITDTQEGLSYCPYIKGVMIGSTYCICECKNNIPERPVSNEDFGKNFFYCKKDDCSYRPIIVKILEN